MRTISKALQILPNEIKKKIKFRLVGAVGNRETHELFNSDHLDVETEIIDEIEWSNEKKIVDAVSRFDIGLAPWRGFDGGVSFKTIQYMACGVVPIVDHRGENQFLIDNGKNGYLVDGTTESFQIAIANVVTSSNDKLLTISNAAITKAKTEFSLDNYVGKLEVIINDLLVNQQSKT